MTPSSSEAAPAPIIRSPWQTSSIFSISARVRLSTVNFWTPIMRTRKKAAAAENFLMKAAQIRGNLRPLSLLTSHTRRTAPSSPLPRIIPMLPAVIKKQVVMDMTDTTYPEKPVVPFIKVTQDRVVLEIQRGCIRGCRFCQAGMLYRPVRERNLEMLERLRHTKC